MTDKELNIKLQNERNIYPNTYIVRHTDYKGERHATEIDALTADEAIVRFIATASVSTKDITATLKPSERPYKFSDLF